MDKQADERKPIAATIARVHAQREAERNNDEGSDQMERDGIKRRIDATIEILDHAARRLAECAERLGPDLTGFAGPWLLEMVVAAMEAAFWETPEPDVEPEQDECVHVALEAKKSAMGQVKQADPFPAAAMIWREVDTALKQADRLGRSASRLEVEPAREPEPDPLNPLVERQIAEILARAEGPRDGFGRESRIHQVEISLELLDGARARATGRFATPMTEMMLAFQQSVRAFEALLAEVLRLEDDDDREGALV